MNEINRVWLGRPYPLGATFDDYVTNFAIFTDLADKVELCLFRGDCDQRSPLTAGTGNIWHAYLPEVIR